jgi:hypothetical protein
MPAPPLPSRSRRLTAALFAAAVAAVLAAGALVAGWPHAARAATPEHFKNATTADYVALCTATQGQENYVAAIHFCEGFATGAYQFYLALASRDPGERFVCLPDPTPSRDKIKADFVAWTKSNPAVMGDPPVESLFRYLAKTYPCAPAAKK